MRVGDVVGLWKYSYESNLLKGHGLWGWAFSEPGTSLCCWASLGRPGLCFYSNPLGGVSYSSSKQWFPEHYHELNVFLLWLQMFNFFKKNNNNKHSNKVKCFHVKSFDRGMLKPDLPWDCNTKYFNASSKYSLLLIIHTLARRQGHG